MEDTVALGSGGGYFALGEERDGFDGEDQGARERGDCGNAQPRPRATWGWSSGYFA